MTSKTFALEFFSKNGQEFKEFVFWVKLEEVNGPIMIYPGHMLITSTLRPGDFIFETINGEEKNVTVAKGWFFANNDKCQIFKIV